MIRIPMIMMVGRDFPAEDVATFVKVAGQRTATKPLTYGSGNTAGHIAAELLKAATKIDMVHVPYRGSPQALQDLVGGHVDLLFGDPYTSMSLVNAGQLKVLGVADGVRHPLLPKVPTMAETGFKDVELVAWSAFFAPANTDLADHQPAQQGDQRDPRAAGDRRGVAENGHDADGDDARRARPLRDRGDRALATECRARRDREEMNTPGRR